MTHVVDGHANRARTVLHRFQAHARGQQGTHLFQRLVESVDHVDGVFVLGFLHRHQQRALAVVEREAFHFLGAVCHACHLRQANGGGATAGDDDLAKVFRAQHASFDLDDPVLLQGAQRTHRLVLTFGAHSVDDLLCAHAQGRHGLWVEVEVELTLGSAHDGDSPHAAHVLQPLFEDLIGPVGQLDGCGGGCRTAVCGLGRQHGQRPNGSAGRIKAQHLGLFDIGAQGGADVGDFFAHIFSTLAAVDVELKLHHHHRLPFVAARGQRIDTSDGVDAFFDFFADFTLHDLRRGTRVFRGDDHHRKVDIGKLVNLQPLVREQTQHHKGQHHHGREDRVF